MRRWYVWLPVSAALLGLLVWRTQPWQATELAAGLDPLPLAIALVLNVPVIGFWAVRSGSLMAAVGSPLSIVELVPLVSFANTINNLTPASTGEVFRAVLLRDRHGVPFDRSAAVILAERLWAIGVMLASAAAASLGTLIPATVPAIALGWLVALVLAFSPSLAYRIGIRPGRLLARAVGALPWERARRIGGPLASLDDRLAEIVLDPRRSVAFVLTTGLVFALFAVQLWLLLDALGADVSPFGAWAAYGLAICAGVISALPFGLGAADAVLVVLLVAQGLPAATAGAVAILLRAVTTLPLGLAGTASWLYLSRTTAAAPKPDRPDAPDAPDAPERAG